jgi:ornithine carbamoyltransferase
MNVSTLQTLAPARTLSKKDLLSVADLAAEEILAVFELAARVKGDLAPYAQALRGKTIVLLFEKPSLRTRVTFDVGIHQLGGHAIYLDHQKVKLGEREAIRDVGRNLERWTHGIVARTYKHRSVLELAASTKIPVVNGLTDLLHPCQALTDFFTIREHFGTFEGVRLCYVGDGNNTCHSLLDAAAKLGVPMTVISPEGYEPNSRIVNEAMRAAQDTGADIRITDDLDAAEGATVLYTDTWASMGQEAEIEERAAVFADYQVNEALLERAAPNAVFLHCLPAHRGMEVSPGVIDSERSLVFDEAENRLHVQNALLLFLVGGIQLPTP